MLQIPKKDQYIYKFGSKQLVSHNTFCSRLKNKAETVTYSKMQRKIKPGQCFTTNNFVVFLSTILFIGCAAFVAFRGYRCFDKYVKNPEHTEISYKSSKNHPFPSFTLCASHNDSYNNDAMKECQLERMEYLNDAQWVGKGGISCLDPKLLHKKFAANYEDLEIEMIKVTTYDSNKYNFRPNNLTQLEWKLALGSKYRRCFAFSIPKNIVGEGIEKVYIRSKPFELIYLHKEGTLSAPIPGSSFRANYADLRFAHVTHYSMELLNYDGKRCNNDREYNYDKCKQDFIYKVCIL
jgi:hypothetical protein